MGLFMELGPCRVKDESSTVVHPESWNTNANIFFVDQPIGVGFSYAEYGEAVVSAIWHLNLIFDVLERVQGTTEEAAKDMASFIAIFFEHFTKFKGRAFHIAGESYGVRLSFCIIDLMALTRCYREDIFQSSPLRFTTRMLDWSMPALHQSIFSL